MSEEHRSDGESLGRDQSEPSVPDPVTLTAAEAETRSVPKRRLLGRSLAGRVAIGLALLAIAAAAIFWWQYRRAEGEAAGEAAAVAGSLEALRAELARVEDRTSAVARELGAALDEERRAREALAQRIEALPARLAELDRRLGAVQGAPFEVRQSWLRAEAEYYLALASAELALAGRWRNALAALDLADQLLAELGDPRLAPVREAIAAERIAVTSVRLPDIEGLAFNLAELASRVDELPLRAELPASYAPPPSAAEDQEPGFGRLLATVQSALLGLVRVERRQTPLAPELTAAERALARRQLSLELALARVAAADGRSALFAGAISRALEILRRDFDTSAAEVERADALLTELGAVEVDPPRPALGRALNQLRAITAGER